MKKITFNPGGCKACMACVELAPEVFEWDDNTGMCVQKQEDVPDDVAQELVAYCPEDCIEYVEPQD